MIFALAHAAGFKSFAYAHTCTAAAEFLNIGVALKSTVPEEIANILKVYGRVTWHGKRKSSNCECRLAEP